MGDIYSRLAKMLFLYHNAPHSTTGVSTAELLVGRRLRNILDLTQPDMGTRVERKQEIQQNYHDKSSKWRTFGNGTSVLSVIIIKEVVGNMGVLVLVQCLKFI